MALCLRTEHYQASWGMSNEKGRVSDKRTSDPYVGGSNPSGRATITKGSQRNAAGPLLCFRSGSGPFENFPCRVWRNGVGISGSPWPTEPFLIYHIGYRLSHSLSMNVENTPTAFLFDHAKMVYRHVHQNLFDLGLVSYHPSTEAPSGPENTCFNSSTRFSTILAL